MLKIVSESHVDHGLCPEALEFILEQYKDRDGFFIDTFTLPMEFGVVDCALYGPIMGDDPVTALHWEVSYERRGDRKHLSRMVNAPMRKTRKVTVIAGPHGEEPCVLYTAFGGPLAPKEIDDPTLKEEERPASAEFWRDHGLARTP